MTTRLLALFVGLMLVLPALAAEPVQFNRDVRPILADTCFACHGPDPGSRKGDLRLDREESFFAASDAIVVRGQPEKSPLYQRITSTDPDMVMPPPKAHKQLTAAQKEVIKRWIAEGAQWQPHWSLIPPVRPAAPEVTQHTAKVRNAIDRFVFAKLEANGLTPADEADPAVLCRRLYLDLTGLPPTLEQQAAFVAVYQGKEKEAAYVALVDKLMQSIEAAEHRARYWLDAARYADTHGLHFDNYREMWPYRDWVVQAFHRNQRFDQFTIEQFAGDLLPNPTVEQRIATGFHRCNITTNEGGTIADENLAHYARDRVETTGWVWLGLTLNCSVCHDHKFDPFTMRDFYSMSAFFRNTTQGSHDGNIKDTRPILFLPQPADAARYAMIDTEQANARDAMTKRRADATPVINEWIKSVQPSEIDISDEKLAWRAALTEGEAESLTVDGTLTWRKDGKLGPAAIFAEKVSVSAANVGNFERDTPFSVSAWVRPGDKLNDGVIVSHFPAKGEQAGWEFILQQGGKLTLILQSAKPKQTLRATSRNSVAKAGQWIHLAAVYDGGKHSDGIQLFVNGAPIDANRNGNALDGSIRNDAPLFVGQKSNQTSHFTDAALQDVRLYERRLFASEIRTLSQLHDLRAQAALPVEKRNREKLTLFYLENRDREYDAAAEATQRLEDERKAIQARATVTHVQEEKMNSPAMANILLRGQYDKLGDKVTPAVLTALNPMPSGAPLNRLGLAQWLMDEKNPLTARVTVNRYWQEVFGTGIVKTSEDFGIMGDPPSHPELLDWLAVEFRESGWDIRHMFRLLVTSATYRQAAVATPQKLEKDRENRLLSRAPRFRMDAEMIRDYALTASGTLSKKMGGPSTKPYQPEGIWDVVGLPGGNTRDYRQDTGENLYRRSLYTFLKRMAPPPNMETFNAPSREFSCLRRERTNTPLQALVTLNDPQFVEASRNLAQKVLTTKADATVAERLNLAARHILCRELREKEVSILTPAVVELERFYNEHKSEATSLITVGESKPNPSLDAARLATWTNVCNTLFNMDEVLNK